MGELDAIGEAVSGGMMGRAVEPKAGEVGSDGHTHETECLNCRTALQGDYCHVCGQHAHVHRTLGAFFHDLLHGVLHFEGKTWRTLPLLAWQPGELTRRYIEGQRARFVSPMALFLFSVFIMFAVLSSTMNFGSMAEPRVTGDVAGAIVREEAGLKQLEADRAAALSKGEPLGDLDEEIASAKEDLSSLRALQALKKGDTAKINLPKDSEWLRGPIAHAIDNPDLLIYKIRTSAYKWSWSLIPISVPFLWLLFPFSRRFRVYDHVVFVTYSLSFMTMLVVAATLIALGGAGQLAALLLLVPPVHFYRQLKGAYGLGRMGALWRTVALCLLSIVALTIFAVLMVLLGVL